MPFKKTNTTLKESNRKDGDGNMLNIAICEDSLKEQEALIHIIENSEFASNLFVFDRGEKLLENFSVGKFDIIFMDIYMTGLNGVETVSEIRKIDDDVSIAFTTTSTDFTLESYRLGALKYIEKPVTSKAVYDLLELVHLKKQSLPQLKLKIKGQWIDVSFDQILYIEQKSHHLFLFLTGGEILRANEKLDNIMEQFEGKSFYRCHKSYLVNLAYIKNLDKELIVFKMKEGKNVHIRRESLSEARKIFESYLLEMTKKQY